MRPRIHYSESRKALMSRRVGALFADALNTRYPETSGLMVIRDV
jgi:hypothetical protein